MKENLRGCSFLDHLFVHIYLDLGLVSWPFCPVTWSVIHFQSKAVKFTWGDLDYPEGDDRKWISCFKVLVALGSINAYHYEFVPFISPSKSILCVEVACYLVNSTVLFNLKPCTDEDAGKHHVGLYWNTYYSTLSIFLLHLGFKSLFDGYAFSVIMDGFLLQFLIELVNMYVWIAYSFLLLFWVTYSFCLRHPNTKVSQWKYCKIFTC